MKPYYQDDFITLYHGDCLQHLDVLDQADVMVTDPPYGMDYQDRLNQYSKIRGDKNTDARQRVLKVWGNKPSLMFGTWRVEKPNGVKNCLVWDKGSDLGMGASTPWGLSHEEIYVLGEWPPLVPGGRVREGGTPSRVPSVIRVPKPNNASNSRVHGHPTPKPVPLMERLIERCPPGVIIDPFAGSGSTLRAAKNLGRKAIGFEIEEKYCEIAANRLAQEVLFA